MECTAIPPVLVEAAEIAHGGENSIIIDDETSAPVLVEAAEVDHGEGAGAGGAAHGRVCQHPHRVPPIKARPAPHFGEGFRVRVIGF